MNAGTLFGIGVGPGDPELIPVKATRILQSVDVVFTAASSRNEYSLAVQIGQPYIPENTPIEKLAFPMCRDHGEKQNAWRQNAARIAAVLRGGRSAAFLTMGDPLTYSTYGYIIRCLKADWPCIAIRTVPGITSYQAAAAAINQPLVEGEETLMILSGVQGGECFRNLACKPDNVVFLKAYRNVAGICDALREARMSAGSVAVSNCSRDDQHIYHDIGELQNQEPNYWTLIIAKQDKHEPSPTS